MDTDTITADNIDARLPTDTDPERSYGNVTADDLVWSNSDKWLTVTLGADETIQGGETVDPISAVKDADGRADATTADPAIPTPAVEEAAGWAWWVYVLIGLGGIILAGAGILLIRLLLPPKGPPEDDQPEEFEF
jgi:hypothetical protein